jgi:hypothetical protein
MASVPSHADDEHEAQMYKTEAGVYVDASGNCYTSKFKPTTSDNAVDTDEECDSFET